MSAWIEPGTASLCLYCSSLFLHGRAGARLLPLPPRSSRCAAPHAAPETRARHRSRCRAGRVQRFPYGPSRCAIDCAARVFQSRVRLLAWTRRGPALPPRRQGSSSPPVRQVHRVPRPLHSNPWSKPRSNPRSKPQSKPQPGSLSIHK